jgi:hypothetical protein
MYNTAIWTYKKLLFRKKNFFNSSRQRAARLTDENFFAEKPIFPLTYRSKYGIIPA